MRSQRCRERLGNGESSGDAKRCSDCLYSIVAIMAYTRLLLLDLDTCRLTNSSSKGQKGRGLCVRDPTAVCVCSFHRAWRQIFSSLAAARRRPATIMLRATRSQLLAQESGRDAKGVTEKAERGVCLRHRAGLVGNGTRRDGRSCGCEQRLMARVRCCARRAVLCGLVGCVGDVEAACPGGYRAQEGFKVKVNSAMLKRLPHLGSASGSSLVGPPNTDFCAMIRNAKTTIGRYHSSTTSTGSDAIKLVGSTHVH